MDCSCGVALFSLGIPELLVGREWQDHPDRQAPMRKPMVAIPVCQSYMNWYAPYHLRIASISAFDFSAAMVTRFLIALLCRQRVHPAFGQGLV